MIKSFRHKGLKRFYETGSRAGMLIMTTTTMKIKSNNMFDPPYPGEILREDVLPAMGLTVTERGRQSDWCESGRFVQGT